MRGFSEQPVCNIVFVTECVFVYVYTDASSWQALCKETS